jgi:hypothetical protein
VGPDRRGVKLFKKEFGAASAEKVQELQNLTEDGRENPAGC